MKIKKIFLIISHLFLCFIVSCNQTSEGILVIDMDKPAGFIDLRISELLDDISIVPLETSDNLLIRPSSPVAVTEQYILVFEEEKLLQFDRKGKFIKVLAVRGNGPNEYNTISKRLIDEKRELMYFTDYKDRKSISCIDLKTGKISMYAIQLTHFSQLGIDSDGYIYGFLPAFDASLFPDEFEKELKPENSTKLAFRFQPQNEELIFYRGTRSLLGSYSTPAYGNSLMFTRNDHIFFIIPNYSDTLFKIEDTRIIPKYIFKLKNQSIHPRKGGHALRVHMAGQEGILFSKVEIHASFREDGSVSSAGLNRLSYLFLDRKNELKTVNSIIIDPLGFTIGCFDLHYKEKNNIIINRVPSISGTYAYFKIFPNNEFLTLIKQELISNQLSSDQHKMLKNIIDNVDEDSNFLLIIGKVK